MMATTYLTEKNKTLQEKSLQLPNRKNNAQSSNSPNQVTSTSTTRPLSKRLFISEFTKSQKNHFRTLMK